MNIGIDLVSVPEFKLKLNSPETLARVFINEEMAKNRQVESLAGIFAAKEAFFKALGEKKDWLDVWVEKLPSGKPTLHSVYLKSNQQAEVSVSHSGDYATAIVVIFEK